MSSERVVTLHVFASAKGGVGKSTLALTVAHLLAARGGEVALLDLDCTGNSLADGLPDFCAPDLSPIPGAAALSLIDEPKGWLDRAETLRRRQRRRTMLVPSQPETHGASALPYLNDALVLDPEHWPVCVDALAWRSSATPNLKLLPSSPLYGDIDVMALWLAANGARDWALRVRLLLRELAAQWTTLQHVVLDLAPGLHGIGLEALVLAGAMASREPWVYSDAAGNVQEERVATADPWRFEARRHVVVSGDPQDMAQAVEGVSALAARRDPRHCEASGIAPQRCSR